MTDPILTVENLSKRYTLGPQRNGDGLRHSIEAACRNPLAWWAQSRRKHEFLALKNISFKVNRGEVLGIIGRNGAGKSTLLKILSRITEPSHGRIHLKGKVASLLEVGTGFHPELTGRENIFLNGAILGMLRTEIKRKLDEIVAFADIEKFLDTPVKRYSSGMYVRLAFAIAAHMEPEILIVDEVLAVGDMEFQKKCIGRMSAVAREGRTVLFVSHNTAVVRNLCSRALVLSHGQIVQDCEVNAAVDFYTHHTTASNGDSTEPHVAFSHSGPRTGFAITRIEILEACADNPMPVVETGDDFVLRIAFHAPRRITKGAIDLLFYTVEGVCCFHISTQPDGTYPLDISAGDQTIECVIRDCPLAAGTYRVGVGIALPNLEWLFFNDSLTQIAIHPRDVYGSGMPPSHPRSLIAVKHHWQNHRKEA